MVREGWIKTDENHLEHSYFIMNLRKKKEVQLKETENFGKVNLLYNTYLVVTTENVFPPNRSCNQQFFNGGSRNILDTFF